MAAIHASVSACADETGQQPLCQNSTNDDAGLMQLATGGSNRVLYLFSGPERPDDGVGYFLAKRDIACRGLDTEISADHDLLDQANWDRLWAELDDYDGRLMSLPCGTFSAARKPDDGGPAPLRSFDGPGCYGLQNLRPEEKEKVRVGNVLAIRSSRVCRRSHVTKKPWMLEQPHHKELQCRTSMFTLDEFQELMGLDGVYKYTFDQCMFGAPWEKATDILSNIPKHPLLKKINRY